MQTAVHEKVRYGNGPELPIQCHYTKHQGLLMRSKRPPHYHKHIEFLYAHTDCDVGVWIAGKEVPLKTGDLVIINSNAAHTFINYAPTSEYICIKALPEMIYSAENSFFDVSYVTPFFGNSLVSFQRIQASDVEKTDIPSAFLQSLDEWRSRDYGYEISLKGLLLKIFLDVIRHNYSCGLYPISYGAQSDSLNTALIYRSVEYINANYADVSEGTAAAAVGMSCSHYSRQFKLIMGKSFREYVNATRINAAERMLLTTDTPITDVALACGFATSSHFIECFKKKKHSTPRQYRQTWKAAHTPTDTV